MITIEQIINAGVAVASRDGIAGVTLSAIAREAGTSRQTLHSKFMDSHSLRKLVFIECINRRVLPVVAQLIAIRHSVTANISDELRNAAINAIK